MAKSETSEASEVDRDLLEETSLAIFIDLSKGRMRGYRGEAVAREAFAQAAAFCKVAQDIRDGGEIPKPLIVQEDAPEIVQVHQWDPITNEPMFDPNTNQPVMIETPGDRYAYAPNLPKAHPTNQRYLGQFPASMRN